MNKRSKLTSLALLSLIISAGSVMASDGCASYPFSDGMQAQEVDGGFKILSTASASVDLDDIDEVLDAMTFAEMDAKARIAKFFNEDIQVDDGRIDETLKSVKITNEGKEVSKDKATLYFKSIRSQSRQILRGVIRIGDCYTKAQLVRVTVGVKPESISAAEGSASSMAESIQKTDAIESGSQNNAISNNTSDTDENASTGDTESFSNTTGIESF